MVRRMFASHVIILLLVVSTSLVFSKKTTTPSSKDNEEDPALSKEEIIESSRLQPSESKLKSRYKGRHGEGRYILHEDEGEGGHEGGKDEEFVVKEGNEDQNEDEHDRGYHNEDKKLDDETLKEYSIKGADQDFREGGASFDKHHKDRASENKENEHINEHDEGEKFGAETLKEHKLGKHHEKSVGHKKHGFKNVYHKEEYGDHKTFHDEFLDNDHHHEYDDQHENRKLEGGRFAKGYFKEGENKELDDGDENHAWGKGGHDSHHEGNYEEGGHITGHRQGHKKREGHHEASGHKHKHSKHKVKKGKAPLHSTTHYHDEHQPQYYARNHKSHDGKEEYSKVFIPDIDPPHKALKKHESEVGKGFSYPKVDLSDIGEDYHNRHQYNKEPESYSSQDIGEGDLYPKEFRTRARLPESTEDIVEPIRHDTPGDSPVVKRVRVSKPLPASENHSFYYRHPQTDILDQIPLKDENPLLRVPQVPDAERHNPLVVHPSPKQHHHIQHQPPHHNKPGIFPTQLTGSNHGHHHHDHRNHHHGDRNHHHRHVVVSQPVGDHEPRSHLQNHHSSVSKPYPWWKHSGRHGDSAQASSQHRFGHERAPQHHSTWVPQNKFRYSEPYAHVASRQHYGYLAVPEFHNVH